ncbi:MAG: hypothetical protein ABSH56_36530 [Bryobacteraceae bacterium]|jgi:hypothetical protein
MKINSKDFRVPPDEVVKLRKCPTTVKPVCESKKEYQELMCEHVKKLQPCHQIPGGERISYGDGLRRRENHGGHRERTLPQALIGHVCQVQILPKGRN